MVALKHLLRNVTVMASYELLYTQAEGSFYLMGYSDNDLANDVDDRRSMTGVLFFLGGNLVSWLSQKQKQWPSHRARPSTWLVQRQQARCCG
jgi:hypothetical protein